MKIGITQYLTFLFDIPDIIFAPITEAIVSFPHGSMLENLPAV